MPPKKNLKLSAVRLRRLPEFSRAGIFRENAFGLIQEYCTGPLAQLVERYIRIVEVTGSNPVRSTKFDLTKKQTLARLRRAHGQACCPFRFKTPWNFLHEVPAEARCAEAEQSANELWWTHGESHPGLVHAMDACYCYTMGPRPVNLTFRLNFVKLASTLPKLLDRLVSKVNGSAVVRREN
jgi:hypothetical protein